MFDFECFLPAMYKTRHLCLYGLIRQYNTLSMVAENQINELKFICRIYKYLMITQYVWWKKNVKNFNLNKRKQRIRKCAFYLSTYRNGSIETWLALHKREFPRDKIFFVAVEWLMSVLCLIMQLECRSVVFKAFRFSLLSNFVNYLF